MLTAPVDLPKNLARLKREISTHNRAKGIRRRNTKQAKNLAGRAPLVHTTTTGAFRSISANPAPCLLSPKELAAFRSEPLKMDMVEVLQGTEGFVFLYCGQFRYPNTQYGFVFSTEIENAPIGRLRVSPFDTGALGGVMLWPTHRTESERAFLARHYLPSPDYRDYLAIRLSCLFKHPLHYFHPEGRPFQQDPIGLTARPGQSPDARAWTFELQVPEKIRLAPPHLSAVICADTADGDSAVEEFLTRLRNEKVSIIPASPGRFRRGTWSGPAP